MRKSIKEKDYRENTYDKFKKFPMRHRSIIIGIICLITITLLIPYGLQYKISHNDSKIFENGHWLLFWGSWLGSIVGGTVTITGVYITLQENRNWHNKMFNDDELKYKEDRRLRLLPHLKINLTEHEEGHNDKVMYFNKKSNCKTEKQALHIKNIGIGSAIDITFKIGNISGKLHNINEDIEFKFDLGKDEIIKQIIVLCDFKDGKFDFEVEYIDILGENKYVQEGYILIENNFVTEVTMIGKGLTKIE